MSVVALGASNLIAHIYYSATNCAPVSITDPAIGSGAYIVIDSSLWSAWASSSQWAQLGGGRPEWFSSAVVTTSGNTLTVSISDSSCSDNRGVVSVYVYRTE